MTSIEEAHVRHRGTPLLPPRPGWRLCHMTGGFPLPRDLHLDLAGLQDLSFSSPHVSDVKKTFIPSPNLQFSIRALMD